MKDIAIDYLGGSGFLVSLGGTGLLFDTSKSGPDRRALPDQAALAAFEKLYVFVSHHHDDHFSPAIYDLCGEKRDHRQQNRNDIVSHACSPVEEERRLEVLLKLNTMK